MKKILIAFDGTRFSDGAFEFARQLNEMQEILLTGVFMPQVSYASLWSYATAMAGPVYVPMTELDETDMLENNIQRFQEQCIRNNITFRVHRDFNDFALPELRKETRFADLLIISSEKFFEDMSMGNTMEYMKEAIHESECPVVVIPEKFIFPKRNVIAYDGSASAVFAMKQFAYILPELAKNETLLVHAKEEKDKLIPDETYIEELAAQHYRELSLTKLDKDPKKYFHEWVQKEEDSILISGAYGRSSISQMFKKSFVSDVIADHRLPVFIAHL